MAFYLKYRPQKISELDLTVVRQSLEEILSAKEIPHAFLFIGPKGTGKTSSARILAKAVNCLKKKKDGEPCNKCDICTGITEARSLDLIEIDAASNRGIDDIRELRDKIKLTPTRSKYKVYIIDEVHMLTNEAFNALLKTLEEPPAHAKFVLCTTEPEKLPGTIVSRCFTVNFKKASVEELVRSLKKVVKSEKIKIKTDDLKLIGQKSDGSFRDGVKILEQLVATGKTVSSKRVNEVLKRGMVKKNIDEWLVLIYEKKTSEALEWFNSSIDEGLNIRKFGVEAIERLRELLLGLMEVVKVDQIKEINDIGKLKDLIELMMRASNEIKGAVVESLPLELAIVEWGDQIVDKRQAVIKEDKDEEKKEKPKTEVRPASKLTSKAGKLAIEEVAAKWGEVLAGVRPINHSVEALLRATRPTGFDGGFLVLEVFYKFHKERLDQERYKMLVEEVASKVLVAPIKVRYHLSQKTQKVIKKEVTDDNISAEVGDDIIKTAEEVFGVKVE